MLLSQVNPKITPREGFQQYWNNVSKVVNLLCNFRYTPCTVNTCSTLCQQPVLEREEWIWQGSYPHRVVQHNFQPKKWQVVLEFSFKLLEQRCNRWSVLNHFFFYVDHKKDFWAESLSRGTFFKVKFSFLIMKTKKLTRAGIIQSYPGQGILNP